MSKRLAATIALTFGVVWALPGSAAATVVFTDPSDDRFTPGSVSAFGGDADNRLRIDYERQSDTFVVTDSRVVRSSDPNCTRIDKRKVRCTDPADPGSDAEAYLNGGDGDDRLLMGGRLPYFEGVAGGDGRDRLRLGPGARGDLMEGGSGADRIFGGDGGQAIDDGQGRDLVRAGDGSDFILVEFGVDPRKGGGDRIYAGAGNDSVSARNDNREAVIDCGAGGDDDAVLDRRIDPAQNCEDVRRG